LKNLSYEWRTPTGSPLLLPNVTRIVQQKISRAAGRVIRIGDLRRLRTGLAAIAVMYRRIVITRPTGSPANAASTRSARAIRATTTAGRIGGSVLATRSAACAVSSVSIVGAALAAPASAAVACQIVLKTARIA
jgi:hypothetical protein